MWWFVAWGVCRCRHTCALVCVYKGWGVCVGWCMCVGTGVCMPMCGQLCLGARRHRCPRDTPSAMCLQGNRGRLGVVVAAYMHYSNISAR